jgi:coatomer protein complex subunit alpha (xenin)
MLRFNTSLLLGDIQDRVKLLAETGQIPLAYLMAKAHGLTEFEKTLEESVRNMEGVDVDKILQ